MSIIVGISTAICALIWFVLGGIILKLTFSEDNCFSRWWPRTFAIIFLIQGICLLIVGIMAFFQKPKENIKKDDSTK